MFRTCGALWLLWVIATLAPAEEPIDFDLIVRPQAHATLVNPQCSHCLDEAQRRAADLRDDDRVLAWTRGKYEGGGIPYRFFLVPYRVISDTYGVFVYDSDAGFARGFAPSLDFTFHGWRNGIMVIKHKDGTLYSSLSGRAFAGPRAGDRLEPVATVTTNWGYWRAAFPGSVAYHMFDKYRPVEIPVDASQDSLASRGKVDPRLPATDEVLGVEIDGQARAYRVSRLKRSGNVLRDRLADHDIYVLWNPSTQTAAAYAPEMEDTAPASDVALEFDPQDPLAPFLDRTSGSRFGIEGRAHDGLMKGKTLRWLDSVQCRWFAWSAEYPHTDIHGSDHGDQDARAPRPTGHSHASREAILVTPDAITPATAQDWRGEGFTALVAVLSEEFQPAAYQRAERAARLADLELYYWIEVGRSPRLAAAHPEWMASLGMHDDWRRDYPQLRKTEPTEVAKAYPWVPIGYRGAFEAHLQRVRHLLARVPAKYHGILVNDLQGGPSSCGCGNLQCRWALDYHAPPTAHALPGDGVAAKWLARVQSMIGARQLIPVWTTECDRIDMPTSKQAGGKSTGLCGDVGCASGICPQAFSRQWQAMCESHPGPIGVLLVESELKRGAPFYGPPGAWITEGLAYLDHVPPAHGAKNVDHNRLWLVVQGDGPGCPSEAARRSLAGKSGAAMVLVARTRIDQTYEPRIQATKVTDFRADN